MYEQKFQNVNGFQLLFLLVKEATGALGHYSNWITLSRQCLETVGVGLIVEESVVCFTAQLVLGPLYVGYIQQRETHFGSQICH